MKKQEYIDYFEALTPEEQLEELKRRGYSWPTPSTCKVWLAKVFTYCNANDLDDLLGIFLYCSSKFAEMTHVCFTPEQTVYHSCICPCGHKQFIQYYTISELPEYMHQD